MTFIFAVVVIFMVVPLVMGLAKVEATGVVAILGIVWSIVACWIMVSGLNGTNPPDLWVAVHAHITAICFIPLLVLVAGLVIGLALSGWTLDPRPHSNADRENHAIVLIGVGAVIAVIVVTAIVLAIAVTAINSYGGVRQPVFHDFGIPKPTTSHKTGWLTYQHEAQVALVHTVLGGVAIIMSLIALLGGLTWGFISGKLADRD